MSGQPESFIKSPRQLAVAVVLGFVVPVLAAVLLAYLAVTSFKYSEKGSLSPDAEAEAVAKRIKPVGDVTFADAGGGAAQARAARTGEQVVQQVCAACHTTGAAGAPKTGDKAGWAKRLGAGLNGLLKTVIAGKGAMPPRGGGADLSDYELERAIVYMANRSGGNMKEPLAPKSVEASERAGEQIVKAACAKCHESGEGGAPRIGDRAAWAQRVSQGVEAVTKSAIHGHGNMPARGGLADLTDAELQRAILYMFSRAGAAGAAAAAAPAPAAAPAAKAEAGGKGKSVYDTACMVCHGAGVAGAPKFGDKAAWAPRIKAGMNPLYTVALKGKGAMPPKGGNTTLADADVKAAVDYMVGAAK